MILITILVAVLILAAIGAVHSHWRRSDMTRALSIRPGRYGAVLSTLGHHADIGATVAGARGAGTFQVVTQGARVLLGFSLSETAGAAAECRLHDGKDATGPLLTGGITFAANGSTGEFFSDEGVEVTSGAITIEVVSGSVRGVVYWG